jgi:dihydroflavonol-4-reductase
MRVFVTGGNGFIGSVVVRKLVARGYRVRCLLRKSSRTGRIDDVATERVDGDIRDRAGLERGMQGCDAAIHLACISSWDLIHSPEMDAVAVEGTRNVLQAALAAGCGRVVYVSSALAVGASRRPAVMCEDSESEVPLGGLRYLCAKRKAEELCREAVE